MVDTDRKESRTLVSVNKKTEASIKLRRSRSADPSLCQQQQQPQSSRRRPLSSLNIQPRGGQGLRARVGELATAAAAGDLAHRPGAWTGRARHGRDGSAVAAKKESRACTSRRHLRRTLTASSIGWPGV